MSEKYDITLAEGLKGAKPRKVKKTRNAKSSSWYYLGFAGQIGYSIAIPLAAGAIIGSFFGHTLIGLIIGFVISIVTFVKVIQEALKTK